MHVLFFSVWDAQRPLGRAAIIRRCSVGVSDARVPVASTGVVGGMADASTTPDHGRPPFLGVRESSFSPPLADTPVDPTERNASFCLTNAGTSIVPPWGATSPRGCGESAAPTQRLFDYRYSKFLQQVMDITQSFKYTQHPGLGLHQ